MSELPDTGILDDILRHACKEYLLPLFNKVERQRKSDGSFVTEADHAMQENVAAALADHWPTIPLLGEEMSDEQRQALLNSADGRVWILDPLDGTSNFAAGVPYFCVSLALLDKNEIVLGLVYDPVRDECFSATRGQGAYLNGQVLDLSKRELPQLADCLAAVDFKRLDGELVHKLATTPPYASQRSFGSVALDWCWLAAGRFHVYLHGRQQVWDFAAGQCILKEAGGYETTLNGRTAKAADMQPRSAVVATSRSLMQSWCDYLDIKL